MDSCDEYSLADEKENIDRLFKTYSDESGKEIVPKVIVVKVTMVK